MNDPRERKERTSILRGLWRKCLPYPLPGGAKRNTSSEPRNTEAHLRGAHHQAATPSLLSHSSFFTTPPPPTMMMKNVSRTVRLPVSLMVFTLCFGGLVGFGVLFALCAWFIPCGFMILCLVLWWLKREKIVSKCARTVAVCTRSSPKSCCVMAKKPYHQNSYKERSSLMLKRIATHGSQQTARVSSFVSPWLVTQ